MDLAVGLVLVALGATGATLLADRMRSVPPLRRAVLLAPFGVLIGVGAAVARGWHVLASGAVGLLLVPVLGVVSVRLADRGRRRRSGRIKGADW